MNEWPFLSLSPGWRLAYDRHQWIVQKRRKDSGRGAWQSVAFVGSNKRVLARVLREKGISLPTKTDQAISTFPERFISWLAQHERQRQRKAWLGEQDRREAVNSERAA